MEVVNLFPSVTSLKFEEIVDPDKPAKRICLGFRRDTKEVKLTSYAYILTNPGNMILPVVIREEVYSRSGSLPQLFPRAATSLLRKAEDLNNPFCFLQFEPHNRRSNVRGMLCAIVLYYFWIAGLDDGAIRWDGFETSLTQALQYINDRPEYQQWIQERMDDSNITVSEELLDRQPASPEHQHDDGNNDGDAPRRGGTVQSKGSAAQVRHGTFLAKLYDILGDRIEYLDALASVVVTFEHQTAFPSLFAYRLLFGTYGTLNAYTYLTPKNKTKITCDGAADAESWTFNSLDSLALLEPFASLMRADYKDSTLADYMRATVFYYFALAEHEGIISDPHLNFNENRAQYLAFACKKLGKTARNSSPGRQEETTGEEATQLERAFEEEPEPKIDHIASEGQDDVVPIPNLSLVIKLRIRSEILEALAGVTPAPAPVITILPLQEVEQLIPSIDVVMGEAEEAQNIMGAEEARRIVDAEEAHNIVGNEEDQHPIDTEVRLDHATSVISIGSSVANNSHSKSPPPASPRTATPLPQPIPIPPTQPPAARHLSNVIDRCGDLDDDDSITLDPSNRGEADLKRDEERWPAQWGAKCKPIVIEDSDEDEELEVVDGDGWRRASLGHARR